MTPYLQADVHFRDAVEHMHLIDMHFVLHKQLTGCMHTTVIASKNFQTTSSQSVPSCHKSIVSVSFCLFVFLLYVQGQQLWSLRDGQFT